MAIFYAVVDGDPLDSGNGGYVTANSKVATVKGKDGRYRYIVFLGDSAYCVACKSVGVIVRGAPCGDSGRMIDRTNANRRQAVEGDTIVCKCERHPSIIAVNGRRWTIRNDGDSAGASDLASTASYSSQATRIYDEQVHPSAPGVTLEGYPYLIEAPSSQTRVGRLDASGKLPRVDTGKSSGDYTVYWGDEALAKQNGA